MVGVLGEKAVVTKFPGVIFFCPLNGFNIRYIRGCTSGGVYAPCIIYLHARCVTVGDLRSLLCLCDVFQALIL